MEWHHAEDPTYRWTHSRREPRQDEVGVGGSNGDGEMVFGSGVQQAQCCTIGGFTSTLEHLARRGDEVEQRWTIVLGHLLKWGQANDEPSTFSLCLWPSTISGGRVGDAAEDGALVTQGMHIPAKVADLELAVDAEEEVLRLDVPVDDVLHVEVGEGIGHLVDIDGTAMLRGAVFCELLVKLTFAGKFEHEEDVLIVVEVPVEAENVGVSEILLDLDFTTDLLLNPGLDNFGLVKTLEG
ncbi:hypothetical protein BJY52DRAFT_1224973 [Lactarius psammicola]|nr:hypothetical protein BJY52DRAFT_1224973 [Lactarius psammicola]